MLRRALGNLVLVWAVGLTGCAHSPLSGADVDRIERPAFISRIEETAGPKSSVFRDDSTWRPRLKKLEPQEGDRRLARKLAEGTTEARSITRFEVADTLRAEILSRLPQELPWTRAAHPADVARVLESFLVQEVPANMPDYSRLQQLETDAVVEIVVEDYGMRSEAGKAGVYLKGYARLFFTLGGEVYRRRFFSDELRAGVEPVDPFAVAKNPTIFRDRMHTMLVAIAEKLASDLNPPDRRGGASLPTETGPGGDDTTTPRTIKRPQPVEEDPL